MKRMIACKNCAARKVKHYDGEWFKRVEGRAKTDMICDWCCPPTKIKTGDPCAAESMGVHGQGIRYYPWESEFIDAALKP